MTKTFPSAFSGHLLHVATVSREQLPANAQNAEQFRTFYAVRNFAATGRTFMYLGKGAPDAPRQIVAWYPNGRMWSSFGLTIKDAVEGAQRDGWMYATKVK